MSSPVVTGTSTGPGLSGPIVATVAPVPLPALQTIDFW